MYQKRTNKKTTKDDAVSPVVGVMLMLVVTIVIAAVVAVFASGLAGTQQSAPAVSASVDLDTKDNITTITFISVSEPIAMSDLQFNLKSTKTGKEDGKDVARLYLQSKVLGTSGAVNSGTRITTGLGLEDPSTTKDLDSPVYVKTADSSIANTYFEKYAILNSSNPDNFDIIYTDGTTKTRTNIPESDSELVSMIKIKKGTHFKFVTCKPGYSINKKDDFPLQGTKVETLEAGDKVTVELVHIPSNSVVYAKTITVGA